MKSLLPILVAAVVSGCAGAPGVHGAQIASDSGVSRDTGPVTLTSSDYGNDWPLTVPTAVVRCEDPLSNGYGSVTVTIEGTEYAVNGDARQSGRWPDFTTSSYWRDDTQLGAGVKVSIDPVIEAGLKLCH